LLRARVRVRVGRCLDFFEPVEPVGRRQPDGNDDLAVLVAFGTPHRAVAEAEYAPEREGSPESPFSQDGFDIQGHELSFGRGRDLNFSPAIQAQREQELAAFIPPSVAAANPDLGWNGTGQLRLQSEQVAGITVQDPQHAVVTLLATVNGQLIELGVPVIASGGGVVVAGEPAWLPAPPQTSPPKAASQGSDPVVRNQLMKELPAFFQA
jgi:hypothetical protein